MSKSNRRSQKSESDNNNISIKKDDVTIRVSDLLPGDILLFRPTSESVTSKKISTTTGSPYTHAAIYLGNGEIAEATPPKVQISLLSETHVKGAIIGVLRSQAVFSRERSLAVREFVEQLLAQNASYDLSGVLKFQGAKKSFNENLLTTIKQNYGKSYDSDELSKEAYFCSALVVACYTIAGIIDTTAQVAYPPKVFSPGDLYQDTTFGWVLGYIVPSGESVPADDPLRAETNWKDVSDVKWWK